MAGPLDELVGGLDPVDVATLFGRFKSAVPLGMAAFSRGLNQGEDEALLKKYGTRPLPPMVEPSAQEMQRRAIEEFEFRYPTPELRAAILEQMRANRRGEGYDPSTATRRIDFAPQNQPDYKGPVATPSTGKRRFQAGGGVKKTVQQMKDELMLGGKGKPVKETVDLSRRSFFRLPEAKSFPLAKVDDTALDKLEQKYAKQGQAPTITKKKIEVSPDAGKTKSTLQSLTETPVSRRMLLKSAGAQSLQGILPAGEIAKELGVPTLAQAAQTVVKPVNMGAAVPAAIIEELGKLGERYWEADYSKYVPIIAEKLGVSEKQVRDVAAKIEGVLGSNEGMSITQGLTEFQPYWLRPSDVAKVAVGVDPAKDTGTSALKSAFRGMKSADPEMYSKFKQGVRDFTSGYNESWYDPFDLPLKTAQELHQKFLRGEKSYDDVNEFFEKHIGE